MFDLPQVDTEPYAKARDADVAAAAAAAGVSVHAVVGHTLYDTAMLVARNNGAAPLTMQSFTKLVDRVGPPPAPRPAPTRVPPPAPGAPGTEPEATGVPTWQEVGFKEPPTTIFKVRTMIESSYELPVAKPRRLFGLLTSGNGGIMLFMRIISSAGLRGGCFARPAALQVQSPTPSQFPDCPTAYPLLIVPSRAVKPRR